MPLVVVAVSRSFILVLLVLSLTVARIVFPRSYKVYGPVACIIPTTISSPVFRMSRGYVQVDRGEAPIGLWWHNHNRFGIHDGRRRRISKLYMSIDTWTDLAANGETYYRLSGLHGCAANGEQEAKAKGGGFHMAPFNRSFCWVPV
jgi:hypothetical protein